jgi:hypothetical protein
MLAALQFAQLPDVEMTPVLEEDKDGWQILGNINTSHPHVPFMLADYLVNVETQQRQVRTSKMLKGEAQVNLFLCSDPECTLAADLRLMIPTNAAGEVSQNASDGRAQLAVVFTKAHNFPLAISAATTSLAKTSCSAVSFLNSVRRVVWEVEGSDEGVGSSLVDALQLLMPGSGMKKLWARNENRADDPHEDGWGDKKGLSTLPYTNLKVTDLITGWSGCATIVLPDPKPLFGVDVELWKVEDDWMYQHGWYDHDPECSKGEKLYLFGSYFNQAWFLQENFRPSGSWQTKGNGGVFESADGWPPLNTSVLGLVYPSVMPIVKGKSAADLRLNASAVQEYGMHMGLSFEISSSSVYTALYLNTHEGAGCRPPRCTVLAVGTATILAYSAAHMTEPDNFISALLALKVHPEIQDWFRQGAPSAYRKWWTECADKPPGQSIGCEEVYHTNQVAGPPASYVWCSIMKGQPPLDDAYNSYGSDSDGYISVCDDVRCGHLINNCSFWDGLGVGYAHGPNHTVGPYNAPSLLSLYNESSFYPFNSFEQGLQYSASATNVIIIKAEAVLKQQSALMMVNVDATKRTRGAVLDTTVLLVAVFAMISGYRDLQQAADKYLMKLLVLIRRVLRFADPAVLGCQLQVAVQVIANAFVLFVILVTLLVAPAFALAEEYKARDGNPKGDSAEVKWLTADFQDEFEEASGPITLVALMASTFTTEYDEAAFALTWVNFILACIAAVWFWVLTTRNQLRDLQAKRGEEKVEAGLEQQPAAAHVPNTEQQQLLFEDLLHRMKAALEADRCQDALLGAQKDQDQLHGEHPKQK